MSTSAFLPLSFREDELDLSQEFCAALRSEFTLPVSRLRLAVGLRCPPLCFLLSLREWPEGELLCGDYSRETDLPVHHKRLVTLMIYSWSFFRYLLVYAAFTHPLGLILKGLIRLFTPLLCVYVQHTTGF